MELERVALLAAHSARSQAYLQALLAADLRPARVITLGTAPAARTAPPAQYWKGLLLPDLAEPLEATCQQHGVALTTLNSDDVNSTEAEYAIRTSDADLLIYSGRGGQIVAPGTLALGPRFLHLHSGWLPEYRGSTTLYYALLDGEAPGVSAILLDERIDTGPVLARRHYPRPDNGMDIDQRYDAAIRADLLVVVMRHYADTGQLPAAQPQNPRSGRNHYVIHPVLKHLAILSLSAPSQGSA